MESTKFRYFWNSLATRICQNRRERENKTKMKNSKEHEKAVLHSGLPTKPQLNRFSSGRKVGAKKQQLKS